MYKPIYVSIYIYTLYDKCVCVESVQGEACGGGGDGGTSVAIWLWQGVGVEEGNKRRIETS